MQLASTTKQTLYTTFPDNHQYHMLQVDLPACNVTLLSSVNGTANCNFYVAPTFFPKAGVTDPSVASLVLRLRLAGRTIAESAVAPIRLHATPAHPPPTRVTMLVTVPYRYLHPGESCQTCLCHVSKQAVISQCCSTVCTTQAEAVG